MKRSLLSVSVLLALVRTAFSVEPVDSVAAEMERYKQACRTLNDQYTEARIELEKTKAVQWQYQQLIVILVHMSDEARKSLSLDRIEFSREGELDLRAMAKADADAGRAVLLYSGGLRDTRVDKFMAFLKNKYGIREITFGVGCPTAPLIRKAMDDYNEIMTESIRKKHPGFDQEKEFEAFVEEWERTNTKPTRSSGR